MGPAGNINFTTAFDYNGIGPTPRTLTLVADNDINLNFGWSDSLAGNNRINLTTDAGGAVNIRAGIDLRGGNFNATGGSGVVNMTTPVPPGGTPSVLLVGAGGVTGAFSAGTLNVGDGVASFISAASTAVGTLNITSGSLNTGVVGTSTTSVTTLNNSGGVLSTAGFSATTANMTGGVLNAGAASITTLAISPGAAVNTGTTTLATLNMSGGELTTTTCSRSRARSTGRAAQSPA